MISDCWGEILCYKYDYTHTGLHLPHFILQWLINILKVGKLYKTKSYSLYSEF